MRTALASVVVLVAATTAVAWTPARASAATSASWFVRDAGRLGDTRGGGFTTTGGTVVDGPVTDATVRTRARPEVPTTATTAVLEVSAVGPTTDGFLQVGPGNGPLTTAVNFGAGASQTVLVTAAIGVNRSLDVAVHGTTQLVVDQIGYDDPRATSTGSSLTPVSPTRAVDTRGGAGPRDGLFTVTLPPVVPAGSTAVVDVTAVGPALGGYLQAGAHGGGLTTAVNYAAHVSQTGLAYVPTDGARRVDLRPVGATDVVVDVVGYLRPPASASNGAYVAVSPRRVADSRTGSGLAAGQHTGATTVTVPASVVPTSASAAVVGITPITPTADGYVRLGAAGAATATTVLNMSTGRSLTATAVTRLDPAGRMDVDLQGFSSDLVVDVVGYYTGTRPAAVTGLSATPRPAALSLTWTNPTTRGYADAVIRRVTGPTPPAGPGAGTAVATAHGTTHAYVDGGLAAGTTYSYAVFSQDATGNTGPAAVVTATTARTGNDVSFNQCGSGVPYPPTALFGVLNPTGQGFAFSGANPCLSSQRSWAAGTSGGAQYYLPLADRGTASAHWPLGQAGPQACPANGTSGTAACAYDYGWDQARDAVTQSGGATTTAWWLDVEDNGSNWSSGGGPQPAAQNLQVIAGAVAGLTSEGVDAGRIGFYSTRAFWLQLTGGAPSARPEWYATQGVTARLASFCATPFASGGRVAIVQDIPQSGGSLDTDWLC